MTWTRNNQVSSWNEALFWWTVLIDSATFSVGVRYHPSDDKNGSTLCGYCPMKLRNIELNIKRDNIPLDGLSLFDILNVDFVKSWVGGFKKVKKWFTSEVVLHLYSERILME